MLNASKKNSYEKFYSAQVLWMGSLRIAYFVTNPIQPRK